MINKKGVRPMGELIGAILITIIIVIIAVAIMFTWFGGLISAEENARESGRALAEGIDNLRLSTGLTGISGVRACNEVEIAIFPEYRLIVDRKNEIVSSQHICGKDEEECGEEGTTEELESNGFEETHDYKKGLCSPTLFDSSAHTTHCNTPFSNINFREGESFNGNDYLIINIDWDSRIVETYCICAISDPSAFAGGKLNGKTIVYPKGWSPTCLKVLDKVTEAAQKSLSNKIKEPFVNAYERIKRWLKRNFGL